MRPTPTLIEKTLLKMGYNISCARRRQRITQAQLAKRSGITIPTLIDIEKGRGSVQIGNIARVLHSLSMGSEVERIGENDVLGLRLENNRLHQVQKVRHRKRL